jgi:hypothetical protein
MSLCKPTIRALRLVPPRSIRAKCLPLSQLRLQQLSTGAPISSPAPDNTRGSLDPVSLHRLEAQRRAYYKRRSYYAAVGLIFGMVAIYVTATSVDLPPPSKPNKLDSSKRTDDPMVVLGRERKVLVQKMGEKPEEIKDVVQTGTSTVPEFPRVLEFSDENAVARTTDSGLGESGSGMVEYQLVGLGIRTVSFLGIQVYVVGLYIATEDIAVLQKALIRKISPVGSTLVAGEKEILKAKLMDPEEGERIWGDVLKDTGIRSLVRIVPTRNTDFHHLRDGWVRQITARAQSPLHKDEYGNDGFGVSMQQFKALFNRGSVPKQKELLLSRDNKGKLVVWYDDGKRIPQRLGEVQDERISRLVWLNYLAGKTVASEGARKSIVDGIIEFVERPVGTVATQVHAV